MYKTPARFTISFVSIRILISLAGLVAIASRVYAVEAARPNIVLIISDNQSAELIGVYGNPHVITPNIDRLAGEGIRFERAYSVSGTCSPARATILTGLLPSQTGVHMAQHVPVNDVPNWSAIEEFRTLPQTLHDAGYRTGLIGKYHLGNTDLPQLNFDTWITLAGGHTTTFYDQEVIDHDSRYKVAKHLTEFWTDKAIDFISSSARNDRPFFLMLAYNGPYMLPPTVTMEPRNKFAEHYKNDPPPFPQEPVHANLRNWARIAEPDELNVSKKTTAWAAIGALNNRTAIINAYAETSLVDEGVGRILDEIEHQGITKDTLIIYTADQGSAYGQHGLWGNTSWAFPFEIYDVHVHIPLVIRHAGRIKANQSSDVIINQFDLMPTLLDYIGLEEIEIVGTPGRSFADTLRGRDGARDNTAFFEFVTVRGIRRDNWKYTKNLDEQIEPQLFDLSRDPNEQNNLVRDTAHQDIVMELDRQLETFFDKYADPRYDLWNGGTGKGRLLEDSYGSDEIFRSRFPDWRPPFVEKAQPFNGKIGE